MQRRRQFLASVGAGMGALGVLGLPGVAHARGKWQTITKESGITVTTRMEKNRQFPTFRGTGRVSANIYDVLAVLQDAGRQTEWMHNCVDAAVLKNVDDTTRIIYNRTGAPAGVSDRDCVLRAVVDIVTPGLEIKTRFRAIKSSLKPPVNGVVRMPVLEGHWYLVAMGDEKCLAEYQVNADPAGKLPDWLVE